MEYPKIYDKRVVINSRDVDGAGECKASALLAYLQDASAEHTSLCGCSRKEMVERYNVFWMLTRIRLQLTRPVRWLEELTVRTGHRGGRGILLYRDYELYASGERVGEACGLWVLADLDTRKLMDLSCTPIPALTETAGGLPPVIRRLTALHPPREMEEVERRRMRYSDTDVNGHINNTRYADFACDALALEGRGQGTFLSGLEITYHAECMPGEEIRISRAQRPEGSFVHGEGPAGDARFDIRMELTRQDNGK